MAEPVPFQSKLFSLLSIVEKIATVFALVAIAFKYLHLNGGNEMAMLSMTTLAGIYFLTGFRPPEKKEGEQEIAGEEGKSSFTTLLATTILPKFSWIACAVLAIGILFRILNLAGAAEMLQMGAVAGVAIIVIFGLLMTQDSERVKSQVGVLYRLVPMLMITSYFLLPASA